MKPKIRLLLLLIIIIIIMTIAFGRGERISSVVFCGISILVGYLISNLVICVCVCVCVCV